MKHIITQTEGQVKRIYLNRPEVLNAINEEMVLELLEELNALKEDKTTKIVIIRGKGRAFCSGIDLKAATAESFQKDGAFMDAGLKLGKLIQSLPQVFIAQVHGYCFTGALEFMLFFDLMYCDTETQFGDTHSKWSIMPRWGLTQRLSRKVGLEKAKELSFRAMRIKGKEAARIGLVNAVFEPEQLEQEVQNITQDILSNSFEAISKIKQLYNQGFQTTLEQGLVIEQQADSKLSSTAQNLKKFKK